MMKRYFDNDFQQFFIELAPNNNKEWFDQNRDRYLKSVKEPFYQFTEDLIRKINKVDPSVQTTVKDSVFRINRDIRFAKDKTPYKMHMSAVVAEGGKKHINSPGIYFEFGPEMIRIYQGAYAVDPGPLYHLRSYIISNMDKFEALIRDKKFRKYYGAIISEPQLRLPREFKAAAEKQPLIANKSYYFGAELSPGILTDKNLLRIVLDHYMAGKNICLFLKEGLKSES